MAITDVNKFSPCSLQKTKFTKSCTDKSPTFIVSSPPQLSVKEPPTVYKTSYSTHCQMTESSSLYTKANITHPSYFRAHQLILDTDICGWNVLKIFKAFKWILNLNFTNCLILFHNSWPVNKEILKNDRSSVFCFPNESQQRLERSLRSISSANVVHVGA